MMIFIKFLKSTLILAASAGFLVDMQNSPTAVTDWIKCSLKVQTFYLELNAHLVYFLTLK
jgi:hypothetical protein